MSTDTFQGHQRIQTACLLLLSGLAISAALYAFRSVFIPFIIAVMLTYCLTPIIDLQMRRLRLPRMVALLTTALFGCVLLFLSGLIVSTAVGELIGRTEEYGQKIEQLARSLASLEDLKIFGFSARDAVPTTMPATTSAPADKISDSSQALLDVAGGALKRVLTETLASLKAVVSSGMLVLIFVIFMLAGRSSTKIEQGGVLREIQQSTQRYLITMVVISGVTAVLVGLTLSLLGVPFALTFGFLAFLLNFIPSLGSIVATLLPAPVVLLSPELSPLAKVLALAIPALIQFTIGNLIQPKVMGQSLSLHPVTVLLSLVFFGTIWGVMGAFLATPIAAIVKILMDKLDQTRPVAHLMAGDLDAFQKGLEGEATTEAQ